MAMAVYDAMASKQSPSPPCGGLSWKWSATDVQSKPAPSAKRQSLRSSSMGPPRCPTWMPKVMVMAMLSSAPGARGAHGGFGDDRSVGGGQGHAAVHHQGLAGDPA